MKHPDVDWSCAECSMCNPSDSFFDYIQEEGSYGDQSSSSPHANLEHESNASIINGYEMKLFGLLEGKKQQPDEGLIIHININSIQNKFDELKTLHDKLKSSIIFISDTKIDHSYPNSQFQLNGYHLYRCDRAKGGGRLIAYFTSKLPSKQVKLQKKYKTYEVLAIDTKIGNINMLFVGIYRPPRQRTGSSCTKYMENVEVELNVICMWASPQRKSVFIIGDLNIDRLRLEKREWKILKDLEDVHSLQCMITEPTRITRTLAKLLDVILTNQPEMFKKCGTVDPAISDHQLIFGIMKVLIWRYQPKVITFGSSKKRTSII